MSSSILPNAEVSNHFIVTPLNALSRLGPNVLLDESRQWTKIPSRGLEWGTRDASVRHRSSALSVSWNKEEKNTNCWVMRRCRNCDHCGPRGHTHTCMRTKIWVSAARRSASTSPSSDKLRLLPRRRRRLRWDSTANLLNVIFHTALAQHASGLEAFFFFIKEMNVQRKGRKGTCARFQGFSCLSRKLIAEFFLLLLFLSQWQEKRHNPLKEEGVWHCCWWLGENKIFFFLLFGHSQSKPLISVPTDAVILRLFSQNPVVITSRARCVIISRCFFWFVFLVIYLLYPLGGVMFFDGASNRRITALERLWAAVDHMEMEGKKTLDKLLDDTERPCFILIRRENRTNFYRVLFPQKPFELAVSFRRRQTLSALASPHYFAHLLSAVQRPQTHNYTAAAHQPAF